MKTVEEQICEAVEAFQTGGLGGVSTDADFVDAAAAWWRGRAEIARRPAARRRGTPRVARLSIRFLREDVAVVHLGWERPGRQGLMTLVMSRAKDAWRIDAAHDSERSD